MRAGVGMRSRKLFFAQQRLELAPLACCCFTASPALNANDTSRLNHHNKAVTVSLGAAHNGLPSDKSSGPQQYQFRFDSVLHNVSQEAVFEVGR